MATLIADTDLNNSFETTSGEVVLKTGAGLQVAPDGTINVVLALTSTPITAVFASGYQNVATTDIARNCTVTRTAVGRWTVAFGSAHPDGTGYEVLFGAVEDANRDVPKVSLVDGTKTANGFDYIATVDDNGGTADTYNDEPTSFAVLYSINVLTNVAAL